MNNEYINAESVRIQLIGEWYEFPTSSLASEPILINAMGYAEEMDQNFEDIKGHGDDPFRVPVRAEDKDFAEAFIAFVDTLEHPLKELRKVLVDNRHKLIEYFELHKIPDNAR